MKQLKSYAEINERIACKKAVVVTADEMTAIVKEKGADAAAQKVDVVTTGTFGPMCSSGALLNVGHAKPRIKIERAKLNGVPAYAGLAAVDLYLGATELLEDDPQNKFYPGQFKYGGAHVIEQLVRGQKIKLQAQAYATDCYPRQDICTFMGLADMKEAILLNPRNCYQNYNVAVNANASRSLYTYLGILRPNMANAYYCSAGQLSPLLNDPMYRTIGIGTRIFLGGGLGYVYSHGTQHNPTVVRTAQGVPKTPGATLAVTGDLRNMRAEYLRACSIIGYGVSLAVGIGIPIPILDAQMARYTAISDEQIVAPVIDYSHDYPNMEGKPLGFVTYQQLRSGSITMDGKKIRTAGLSSYSKARAIACELKEWIQSGDFLLSQPADLLPGANTAARGHFATEN